MTLRIGFFYPNSSIQNPIDPKNVFTSSRGLTGSEGSCVMYAIMMARLGHSVTLFSKFTHSGDIENVTCCHYDEWANTYNKQNWDALCSWMTPEPLKIANPLAFRLFDQQVSDFNCCEGGWESYVDIVAPLSHSHANHLKQYSRYPRDNWRVAYNGVDINSFTPKEKERGKVIWASSHDRGLHWLLEVWPKVQRAVPYANLHIFYNFSGLEVFVGIENHAMDTEHGRRLSELGQRSRYTLEAIRRLQARGMNVHVHKSVSRERMKEEMASSYVLGFPLQPIHYTETFGVTVLEACASGTVPVICADDCFSELWAPVSVSVPPPYYDHKDEYVSKLIKTLSDDSFRNDHAEKCVKYAAKFDWNVLVKSFEETLLTRGQSGMPKVNWVS